LRLFVILGSQYCSKVMAAMDSRGIAFSKVTMPMDAEKRRAAMPAPTDGSPKGSQVPVLATADEAVVVPDSEAILDYLDDLGASGEQKFYPSDAVRQLDRRVSARINLLGPLYHNWVSDAGFQRSMRVAADNYVPSLLRGWVPWGWVLRSARKEYADKVRAGLDIPDGDPLPSEAEMQGLLAAELKAIQDEWLKGDESQRYLAREASLPTGADCGLYALLDRTVGTAGDVGIPAALPEFWEEQPELGRLRRWFEGMHQRHPIVYKGRSRAQSPAAL